MPSNPLPRGFERNDVLSRGEDNAPERDHAFLPHRLPDCRESLKPNLAIGHNVVGLFK
jgi:hypothetical protein